MMYLLWVLAFLGVAVIYFGGKVCKAFGKDISGRGEIIVRSAGMLISAVAMVLLYTTGNLI